MSRTLEKSTALPDHREATFPSLGRWGWRLSGMRGIPQHQMMRIEETRENGSLVIRAELPGIDVAKDVNVSLLGDVLTIQAERRENHEEEESGIYRSEFRYGSFSRQVPLPRGCSLDDVKASYADGILEVRMPMNSEVEKPVRIKVQTD